MLVDDVPHYSCSILTHAVRGKQIVTIEGLAAADGTLHPVQQGVVDEQGFQCAFCMSGFIMAAVGFLKTNPNPTRAQLLCMGSPATSVAARTTTRLSPRRCVVLRTCGRRDMAEKLVGQNYTTPDLIAKVTGKSKDAEDFRAEGMLFAKLLFSPHPHARVTRIDTSAAMALPGVKAILTVDDLPAPADAVNDNGQLILANIDGEVALTKEAGLPGSADSGGRGGRRGDGGRGHRADRDRGRGAALRGRSVGEPASGRRQRAHERQLLVHSCRQRRAGAPPPQSPPRPEDP